MAFFQRKGTKKTFKKREQAGAGATEVAGSQGSAAQKQFEGVRQKQSGLKAVQDKQAALKAASPTQQPRETGKIIQPEPEPAEKTGLLENFRTGLKRSFGIGTEEPTPALDPESTLGKVGGEAEKLIGSPGVAGILTGGISTGATVGGKLVQPGAFGTGRNALSQILLKTTRESKKLIPGITSKVGRTVVNSKSGKLVGSMAEKIATKATNNKAAIAIITTLAGTYGISEWAVLDNAKQGLNIASINMADVMKSNPEGAEALLAEYLEVNDAVYNPDTLNQISRALPIANMVSAFTKGARVASFTWKVNNAYLQDQLVKIQTEQTEEDYWEEKRVNEQLDIQANRDDAERRRKRMVLWEQEARAAGDIRSANFWAEEKKKTLALELEQQKEIIALWTEYKKLGAMQGSSDFSSTTSSYDPPSKLNFGLL